MQRLKKMARFSIQVSSGYEYLAVVTLILVTGIIFVEVIARFFRSSIFVLLEITGAALVVMTFSSLGAIFIRERHLRIDILISRISGQARQVVELGLGILAILLTCFCTYLWLKMLYSMYQFNSSFEVLPFPKWPFQILVILGWVSLIIGEIRYTSHRARQVWGRGERKPQK